jgi:hypothetical protein
VFVSLIENKRFQKSFIEAIINRKEKCRPAVELWRQPVLSTERERAAEGRLGNECGAFISVAL